MHKGFEITLDSGLEIYQDFPKTELDWNDSLMQSSEAGLLQSYYWASVLEEVDSARPIFVTIKEGEEIVAKSLLLLEIDGARSVIDHPLRNTILKVRACYARRLSCMDGPVLSGNAGLTHINYWIDFVEAKANQYKTAEIGPIRFALTSRFRDNADVRCLLEKKGFSVKQWGTFITDLTPDIETIWGGVQKNARNKVRKAERHGVILKKIQNLDERCRYYYEPYLTTRHRQRLKLKAPSFKVAESTFRHDQRGINHFFSALDNDENVLALCALHCFNGVATVMSTGITDLAYERRIPAQDFLRWKTIEWAKGNGNTLYDIGGVNPEPKTEADFNLYLFKKKWGGQLIRYDTFSKRRPMPFSRKLIRRVSNRILRFLDHD